MQYNQLGETSLKVSVLCLGTMTFGRQNTEAEGFAQMDRALEYGVNFFDTAEMYPVPAEESTSGRTEAIIGNWFRRSGKRDQVILATKVIGKGDWLPHIRNGQSRPDRRNIMSALEDSLKRLQTDYIDLYQIHWPDRSTNYFGNLGYEESDDGNPVGIAETLEVLDELVDSGKVRQVGVSNETPWGVMEYLRVAGDRGFPRVVSVQNPYNLLNRSFEVGLAEIAHREKVGLLAYSPLAFGMLSGKYLDADPPGCRLSLFPQFSRYRNPGGESATREYVQIARNHGLSPVQLALAYINSRPFLTSNIIGATTLEQLEENLGSTGVNLDSEVLEAIESVHRRISNPCP